MSDLRQREPRMVDEGFLAFVRTKRCAFCGAQPVQAAHIRMADLSRNKPFTGRMRPDDRWCTPLCQWCHLDGPESQHKIGEEVFWRIAEINPFVLAEALYKEYGGDGGRPRRKQKARKPRPPKERRRQILKRAEPWGRRGKLSLRRSKTTSGRIAAHLGFRDFSPAAAPPRCSRLRSSASRW